MKRPIMAPIERAGQPNNLRAGEPVKVLLSDGRVIPARVKAAPRRMAWNGGTVLVVDLVGHRFPQPVGRVWRGNTCPW